MRVTFWLLVLLLCRYGTALSSKGRSLRINRKTSLETLHSPQVSVLPAGGDARRTKFITGLMGLAYLGTIVSVMTLPCTLSLVDRSLFAAAPVHSGLSMSRLLFLATMGTVAGKLLLGPPTDKFGGHFMLQLCLAINALALGHLSTTASTLSFSAVWIIVSFLYGSTWGAVSAVVRREFRRNEWGSQLGITAAFSRVGSLGSSLAFGAILASKGSWRSVFRAAAALQAIILAIYLASGNIIAPPSETWQTSQQNVAPHFEEDESAAACLKRAIRSSVFWGMLLGKTTLLGVGQMIGFFSLFIETGLGFSAAKASSYSGLFALGSLASSVWGSRYYRTLPRNTKIRVVSFANIVGVGAPVVFWMHVTNRFPVSPEAVLGLITTWGFSWALAFYIPPGILALQIGGKRNAALITNIADGAGFTLAALFSTLAMSRGRVGGAAWGDVMLTLAGFSGVALVSLRHAMGAQKGD